MSVSRSLRFAVLERDNHTCTYCGRRPPEVALHVDHVVPTASGGETVIGNLVTACVDCNAGKGSRLLAADASDTTLADAQKLAFEAARRDNDVLEVMEEWDVAVPFGPSLSGKTVRRYLASIGKDGFMEAISITAKRWQAGAFENREHARRYLLGICRNKERDETASVGVQDVLLVIIQHLRRERIRIINRDPFSDSPPAVDLFEIPELARWDSTWVWDCVIRLVDRGELAWLNDDQDDLRITYPQVR